MALAVLLSHSAWDLLDADGITAGEGMREKGWWGIEEEEQVLGSGEVSRGKEKQE